MKYLPCAILGYSLAMRNFLRDHGKLCQFVIFVYIFCFLMHFLAFLLMQILDTVIFCVALHCWIMHFSFHMFKTPKWS